MAIKKIFLSSKADKQLNKLPQKMHDFALEKIEDLKENPYPSQSKKLVNREGYRIRVGDYRILYALEKKRHEIVILSVAHRKDAYKY